MTLLRRILLEKRAVIIPVVLCLLVNLGVYVLVVYPLGVKSAGTIDRAIAAERSAEAAARDLEAARMQATGKVRAEEALATFYDKVLPANQYEAVKETFAPLPAIAKEANVRVVERRWEPDQTLLKNSRVGRLQIHMGMQGDYQSVRQFIYQVERATGFIIIENLTLAQTDQTKPLTLTLDLSAYYRVKGNGS